MHVFTRFLNGTYTDGRRDVTGLPVIANGGMHSAALSATVLTEGHADLIAIGRGALANPDWPQRIARGGHLREFDDTMLKPDVTLATQAAWEHSRGPR